MTGIPYVKMMDKQKYNKRRKSLYEPKRSQKNEVNKENKESMRNNSEERG